MSSILFVGVLVCLISVSLEAKLIKVRGGEDTEKMKMMICKNEAQTIHKKYEAAFNAGDLDRLAELFDPKAAIFPFKMPKIKGKDGIFKCFQPMMAHHAQIQIDREMTIQMKHGFHEFYAYGKITKSSDSEGPETIFYKHRIIRVEKGPQEAHFFIWSEHLSHGEIPVKQYDH